MSKYFALLTIPFFFSLVMEIFLFSFNENNMKESSTINNNLNYINLHKDFENSKNNLNYDKKIVVIAESKKKLISQIPKKFVKNLDSEKINEIYSEKIIVENSFSNLQLINKINDNIFINNENDILNYSVQLVSTDWQGTFSQKKINFIKTVLPLINHENQKILIERSRLNHIKTFLQVEKTLVDNDIIYLNYIAKKYKIKTNNKHKIDILDELLLLIDVIPNSIVLAQAANESGWGTSRFAKEYNALFGQYTYDENNGIVPFDREEGKKHLVKYFDSFNKSVESYFRNINTHYAYQKFRNVRSKINRADLNKNIKLLTRTLDVYAEDKSYVKTINAIIDTNNLIQFDLNTQMIINS